MTRFALTLAILLASALPAWGQQDCGKYRAVVKHLAEEYGEHLVAGGIAASGDKSLRIFANPEGATWTALEVSRFAGGQKWACMIESGTYWRRKPLPLGPVS